MIIYRVNKFKQRSKDAFFYQFSVDSCCQLSEILFNVQDFSGLGWPQKQQVQKTAGL